MKRLHTTILLLAICGGMFAAPNLDDAQAQQHDWENPHVIAINKLPPLCFNAWDYAEEDIQQAAHPYEVQRGRFVNVNIDSQLHGVGGKDTWGGRTLPQYTVDGNKPHHLAFVLHAISVNPTLSNRLFGL